MAINLNNPQTFQQFKQPNQQGASGVSQNQRQQPQQQGVQQQQSPVQRKQQGTGFTNVGQVVGANVGQGQKMGQQIAQNYATQVGSSLGQMNEQMQKQQQDVQSEQQRLGQAQQFAQQVQQDPNQIAQNQQQMQQFQQLYNPQAISQGQQSQFQNQLIQNQQQLQQQQQQLAGLSSQEGRQSALQRIYQGPGYTQGQQKLDQLVLGQAGLPAIQQQRQQLQQQLAGAKGQQQLSGKQLLAQIQGNIQKEREASDLLRGTVGTQTSDLIAAQEQEAAQKQMDNQRLGNIYTRFLQGDKTLSAEDKQAALSQLQGAGLSEGQRTYNVLQDYNKYLNQPGQITTADVLTQPEFQRYQALSQLAGISPEQMQFHQAGTGGEMARIKAQQLASDIQKAEQEFAKSAIDPFSTTQSENLYRGNARAQTHGTASLQNYLASPEQFRFRYGGDTFGYTGARDINTDARNPVLGTTNAIELNAVNNWIRQAEQRLNDQGYRNTLGGADASAAVPQSLLDLWKQQT